MVAAAYLASIVLLLTAHFLKVLRWGLMTDIYNETRLSRLMGALSVGYVVNFIVPLRAGEAVRAFIASRKTNSGFIFYFVTVLIERLLDFLCVFLLFGALFVARPLAAAPLRSIVINYSLMLGLVVAACLLGWLFRAPLKRLVLWLSSIFNSHIQLRGLLFAWSGIRVVKDFAKRINKLTFLLLSGLMWASYLLSYYLFTGVLQLNSPDIAFTDLLIALFGPSNLFTPQLIPIMELANGNLTNIILFVVYILSPLALMLLASRILKGPLQRVVGPLKRLLFSSRPANVVPIADPRAKLNFLTGYFSGARKSEYYQAYIEMNKDIYVLQEMMGGSNATTVQILKDGDVFYRKYAFYEEASKLRNQAAWLQGHPGLPLPRVVGQIEHSAGFCYDMDYDPRARDFFTYIHSTSVEDAWGIVQAVLEDVDARLHSQGQGPAQPELLARYVDEKMLGNLDFILSSALFAPLVSHASLFINGTEYQNLAHFDFALNRSRLLEVFAQDGTAPIHGDLTVENIIFSPAQPRGYYLIDPNPENLHNTPLIDYAKLLQSLQYGYEFLQKTTTLEIQENRVSYPAMRSRAYDGLLKRYRAHLAERFEPARQKSIHYHLIANVLRLIPYKMTNAPKQAPLYYCGLVILMNELAGEGLL